MTDPSGYAVADRLITAELIAGLYAVPVDDIQIFRIPDLNVVKVSFPRQVSQGSLHDRDIMRDSTTSFWAVHRSRHAMGGHRDHQPDRLLITARSAPCRLGPTAARAVGSSPSRCSRRAAGWTR